MSQFFTCLRSSLNALHPARHGLSPGVIGLEDVELGRVVLRVIAPETAVRRDAVAERVGLVDGVVIEVVDRLQLYGEDGDPLRVLGLRRAQRHRLQRVGVRIQMRLGGKLCELLLHLGLGGVQGFEGERHLG